MGGPDTEFFSLAKLAGLPAELESGDRPVTLPTELPVLGLSDVVIFPGNVSPLLVDGESSVRLVDDVLAGDRLLSLVLQTRAETQEPTPAELHRVGCAARVLKMLKNPDGSVRILVEGLVRVRVGRFTGRKPYLRARVTALPDRDEDVVGVGALVEALQRRFQEVLKAAPSIAEHTRLAAAQATRPGRMVDLVAGTLNLSLVDKQNLLETVAITERVRRLGPLVERELEMGHLSARIQDEVTTKLAKGQRDYYLREQLRVIRRELGEQDPAEAEWNGLRERIAREALPDEVRALAGRELERLAGIPSAVAEHTVLRSHLDWLLELPWSRLTVDRLDLEAAARLLDREHHGLQRVKDRLLEFLAVMKLKPESRAPILCLVGPPGVGKTSLGRSLAAALGRSFVRIALGGVRDEAEIRGHRRTYVAAMPGRILQGLRRAGSRNPVMLLDELDKLGSDFRGDPAAALLEVLDPEQNRTFADHYLELPFDLSRVLFVTTANWLDPVPAALRDRLEVIELPSYTVGEKLEIVRRHLLPRQRREHGLGTRAVRFGPGVVRRIVEDYTREAGVRQLDRELAAVLRKAARRLASAEGEETPIEVTAGELPAWLGPPRYAAESLGLDRPPGVALGLAWTPVGGEVLHIEASRMPGSGKLILTGSLGDVMKESAQAALSFLRARGFGDRVSPGDHERFDLHVHVPSGGTPKDGPSAGLAVCVALASLFAGARVRPDTAVTGEISLRGRVLPVGGIREKLLAAVRHGLRRVVLPEGNRKDLPELPPGVLEQVETVFVREVDQALSAVLESRTL